MPYWVERLERRSLLSSVSTLLQYDFNSRTAWPGAAVFSTSGTTAAGAQANVGTIDVQACTTQTGAESLTVSTAPSSGSWSSQLSSGAIAGQIYANGACTDVRIYNNILVAIVPGSGQKAAPVNGGTAPTSANQIVYNNNLYFGGNQTPYMGTGDLILDPQLVAPSITASTPDFRLQSTSPAINAGTTSFAPSVDFLGNVRNGVPDIGAYEYYASVPTVVTSAAAFPSPVSNASTGCMYRSCRRWKSFEQPMRLRWHERSLQLLTYCRWPTQSQQQSSTLPTMPQGE